MLNQFKEFYGSLELDISQLDENTLICFDTNVLLHIYRYSDDTRKKLFEAIEKVKEHIFIPYHVGLEFNLNKKNILNDVLNMNESITSQINKSTEKYIKKITTILNNTQIKSTDEKNIRKCIIKDLETKINETMDSWIKESLSKEFNLINKLDYKYEISNDLAILLKDKVGPSYTQEEINKIEKEGKERYENKVPPGYGDDKATDKQNSVFYNDIKYVKKYGDLIFWNQIIDRIRLLNEKKQITKIILITDDAKEDWIYEVDGKQKGVRAELRKEMLEKTGAFLHVKDTNGFLMWALEIEEHLIQESNDLNLTFDNINLEAIDLDDIFNNIEMKQENEKIIINIINRLDSFKNRFYLLENRIESVLSKDKLLTGRVLVNNLSLDDMIKTLRQFRKDLNLFELDIQNQLKRSDVSNEYKSKLYAFDDDINILNEQSSKSLKNLYHVSSGGRINF